MAADDLVDRVADLPSVHWDGIAYRHTSPQREPLSGVGAALMGGRWNPKGLATIYLAFPEDTCVAEFRRMARGQGRGMASFLPRDLHVIRCLAVETLDLSDRGARRDVGITLRDISSRDWALCQEVGGTVAYLGFQAVLAPSASGAGNVLAVYEQNLRRGQLTVIDTRPMAP